MNKIRKTKSFIFVVAMQLLVLAILLTACASTASYNLSITTNGQGEVTGVDSYKCGDSVTVTASASSEYVFEGWYIASEKVSSNEQYTFVMPEQDIYLTASFVLETYEVSVVNLHGTISGDGEYVPGANVTLTVTADGGYTFSYWEIVSGDIDSSINNSVDTTISFAMPNGDVKLTTNYTKGTEYTLSVSISGDGEVSGSVTNLWDWATVNKNFAFGESVTLKAVADTGYVFVGWYKNTYTLVSTSSTYTFTMPESSLSLTAKFSKS